MRRVEKAAVLGLAALAGNLAGAPRGPGGLEQRIRVLEAAVSSGGPLRLPEAQERVRMEEEVRRATGRGMQAVAAIPEVPRDLVGPLRDIVEQVGDIPVVDWFEIYGDGPPEGMVEAPIAVQLRAEWVRQMVGRLAQRRVVHLGGLPAPDPRLLHMLLRCWARGGSDVVAGLRVENVEALDRLGAFELYLGESFQRGLGEKLRAWIQDPPEGESSPPSSTGRQIRNRAEAMLAHWPPTPTVFPSLGQALEARGDGLSPLPEAEEPSLVRLVHYQLGLRRALTEEEPVRPLYGETRDLLRAREDLPEPFRDRAQDLLEDIHDHLATETLADTFEVYCHPHAPPVAADEFHRAQRFLRSWRAAVRDWAGAPGARLEAFPLPRADDVMPLLERLRAGLENPTRGSEHVWRRAEWLDELDRMGFFEAAAGARFFGGNLAEAWETVRDNDLGEVETDRRLRALELQLAARLGRLVGSPGWRLPGSFGEAIRLRGEALRGDSPDPSLLRLAYEFSRPPDPADLPPSPPSEVPAPPWVRDPGPPPAPPEPSLPAPAPPEPVTSDPAPPVEPPARRKGKGKGVPAPLVLLGLVGLAGGGAWAWRRRKGAAPVAPEGDDDVPATVVPRPAPTSGAGKPDPSIATVVGRVDRTHVSEPGAASARAGSATVASGAGVPEPASVPRASVGGGVPSWLQAALDGALGARYRDHVMLGAGGMGTVVRAFDTRLERTVAVKVPPPHLASHEEFQIRFLREARAVARLDHPNIGRVIDVPEVPDGELPVMILEYLDGVDLATYLDRQGRPSGKVALGWVRQAGAGLQHAHEQGILHRDIKPANLMLVGETVKILDFGLAALEDRKGLTRSGMLMGSIPYMPPEQLRGEPVGVPADVYALGVTAYQLLTGQLPFDPEDAKRLAPPRISQAGTGAPAVLDDLLLRALAPDPADRYETVRDFLAAIDDLARRSRRGS